jgi:hypothetical protein
MQMTVKVGFVRVAAVVVAAGLAALATPGEALARDTSCAIQTWDGHYVTAVNGDGLKADVIHTDATIIGPWEKFELVERADNGGPYDYSLKPHRGSFLTAMGGGGRTTDVIHSDGKNAGPWEIFTLVPAGGGWITIQTSNNFYLTAMYGGGQVDDVIHSNATSVGPWEKFKLRCR